jgi:hypothetical protein
MKKLTTLFLAIFLSAFQFINAQVYYPLIEEGKSWDDLNCMQCMVCANSAYRYFYAGEDTLINGLTYAIIGRYNFIFGTEVCPPYVIDTVPNSGIRFLHEDTLQKKVYWYNNSEPVLMYDFSLQVGDAFISDWVTGGNEFKVVEIDEVEILNGELRKRWIFESEEWPTEPRSYIEGIGMEDGLFGDFIQFEWWTLLACVKIGEEQLWDGGSNYWGGCYGLVGEDEITTGNIQIYPNPATIFIRISLPNSFEKAELKIYNSLGQLVFEDAITSENTVVNVSGFERGIYLVLIETDEGVLKEKLIIR